MSKLCKRCEKILEERWQSNLKREQRKKDLLEDFKIAKITFCLAS